MRQITVLKIDCTRSITTQDIKKPYVYNSSLKYVFNTLGTTKTGWVCKRVVPQK